MIAADTLNGREKPAAKHAGKKGGLFFLSARTFALLERLDDVLLEAPALDTADIEPAKLLSERADVEKVHEPARLL